MPAQPTSAQSLASRQNGARSAGPATEAGKARSAQNATRHGLAGSGFRLLPDEDPEDYARHEVGWLRTLNPADLPERDAALAAVRAMWREIRADRLEAQVLAELFAADAIEGAAEARAAKQAGWRALSTLIRYRGRIQREHDRALAALDALRQRPRRPETAAVRSEPEPVPAAMPVAERRLASVPTAVPGEPEPPPALNRHQRRALAAMQRKRAA